MGAQVSRFRSKSPSSTARPSKPVHPITSPAQTSSQTAFLAALKKAGIHGSIKTAGHVDFAFDTIPWNLRCQPKPLALVYAANPQDVSTAVKVAAKYGIPVQPRSGGHSFASYSLGGTSGALVIDLAAMNKVVVDQTTWKATIGGGTKLASVTDGLYKQGKRTIAHGVCPQVGIGGHATIGGQGPLSRTYGLTLDHVIDMEVVIADGSIVRANASDNPDLYWALRGAGASFGVVTSFVVETHPAPTTITHYSFQLTLESPFSPSTPSSLASIYSKWQSFISSPTVSNDRAFNSIISVTKYAVLVQGSRFGTKAELEASEVMVLLKNHFEDIDLKISELDWLASVVNWATDMINTISGGLSIPAYMKSLTVRQSKPLTPPAIAAWFEYMHKHAPHDSTWVVLGDLEGGRTSDFPNDATAYAQRDALYTLTAYALAPLPFPDNVLAFLNGMLDTINEVMPDGDFGVYPGYVDPLIPKNKWPTQYWGANYPRLLEIKSKYDPQHVFANPQSVGSDVMVEKPKPAGEVIKPVEVSAAKPSDGAGGKPAVVGTAAKPAEAETAVAETSHGGSVPVVVVKPAEGAAPAVVPPVA